MERRRDQDIQIRLEGVNHKVNGKILLKDINITVDSSKVYLLLGRNGAGKTTLLKILAGLVIPTSGKIFIDEKEVTDTLSLKKLCGYIFQNPQTQIIGSTVEEDVAFGLENLGISRQEMLKIVEETLKEVELLHLRCADPITLSGGQMQRLAIASVVALWPSFLLLDEPLSMLDEPSKKEVLALLKNMKGKRGLIIATHDTQYYDFADEVIYLKEGKAYQMNIKEFFSSEHEDVFIPSWALKS